MITFPQPIEEKLAKRLGTQPILLVEIDWKAGTTVVYSDTKEYLGANPRIVSVGTIDAVGNSAYGDQLSNEISIVLDATDESVENIFRNNDVHLRPVRLYLGYSDTSERALLFNGLINSQVVWGEDDRTLQFQVLNKLEDSLVGFAMEDGNFPLVSQDDRGKDWPLPFGTVCHYKAQRLTTTIKGFLEEGVGATDPTLANRICQIEKTECPLITVPALRARGGGSGLGQNVVLSEQVYDPNCLTRKRNEGCSLKDLLAQQQASELSSFGVRGGEAFPQNKSIRVRIGTISYQGVMNGTTFTVEKVFHPDVTKVAECRNVKPPRFGVRFVIGNDDANKCLTQGNSRGYTSGINRAREPQDCITATSRGVGGNRYSNCGFGAGGEERRQMIVGGSADSWAYYDSMEEGRYIWNAAGTDVILQEFDDDLVYMVSLVPGTVTKVLAYREFGEQKLLSEVPTSWYTVQEVDYGGYTCVELRFNQLPSTDTDQPGWSDDIIVSFVSSVGPSPVDIIEWLVDTYTDFSVDSANFAAVKATLTEFESNFVLKGRPGVLDLINKIAYQHRVGVRVANNVVQLVYLAEEPTSQRTLTSGNILQGSFKIRYTQTEQLRTNHKITWRPQYEPNVQGRSVDLTLDLRFNIPKYGNIDETQDWETQNTFETVLKTSTFWLIRKSNTWQEIDFETPLDQLDVEILDCVTINIPQFPANTKVVIQEKRYNTDTNSISWKAWTPIRAGESVPYQWAWPATVAVGNRWPTAGEIDQQNIGDGSGRSVVPPEGHPLRVGYSPTDTKPVSVGDTFPSDVGFVAPEVVCEVPLGNEVIFAQSPLLDPLSRQNFQNDMQNKQNGNSGGVSGATDREEKPCSITGYNPCAPELGEIGDPPAEEDVPQQEDEPRPCWYYVKLTYITPTLVRNNGCVGGCMPDTATPGAACNGTFFTVQTVVSNYQAAEDAVLNHNQQVDFLMGSCGYEIGVTAPSSGTTVISYDSNGTAWFNVEPPSSSCPTADTLNTPEIIFQPEASVDLPEGSETPEPDVTR